PSRLPLRLPIRLKDPSGRTRYRQLKDIPTPFPWSTTRTVTICPIRHQSQGGGTRESPAAEAPTASCGRATCSSPVTSGEALSSPADQQLSSATERSVESATGCRAPTRVWPQRGPAAASAGG